MARKESFDLVFGNDLKKDGGKRLLGWVKVYRRNGEFVVAVSVDARNIKGARRQAVRAGRSYLGY